jgi:branched-chain amino acid transport system ATP-binding protein
MPEVALELRHVHKRFGHTPVLCGVSLAVHEGERVAVIGPNGAGKSTLFDVASGALAPDSGEVLLRGERIDGHAPYDIRQRGLARSFQASRLFGRLSVYDNLRCALLGAHPRRHCFWRRLDALADVHEHALRMLALVHLDHRQGVPAVQLSYAEQRALDVAMALAGSAHTVLLDEPTAGMSRSETQRFVQLLRQATQGRTLLVVEHDMGVVQELADRVAVLVAGEVLAEGSADVVRADPRVRQAYLGTAKVEPAGFVGEVR